MASPPFLNIGLFKYTHNYTLIFIGDDFAGLINLYIPANVDAVPNPVANGEAAGAPAVITSLQDNLRLMM